MNYERVLEHLDPGFKENSIEDAINGSLKRLKTDYLDLYQLHWPERMTTFLVKEVLHMLMMDGKITFKRF